MFKSLIPRLAIRMIACVVVVSLSPDVFGQDVSFRETSVFRFNDIIVDSMNVRSSDVGEYIIQFQSPPLATVGNDLAKRGNVHAAVASDHRRFEDDAWRVRSHAAGVADIRRRFSVILNGMSATLDERTVQHIRSLPYVKSVRRNLPVRITADMPDIRWTASRGAVPGSQSSDGEGITIAVVDTGIDWTHADLGGGIGPDFKVMGGYDFVNDDDDPMDDHGHGTHVAGIAAAAGGTHPGIAPVARLLAYKVLDAGGGGFTDAVIAGVERAMDPDADGSFSDAADIVNLSLGADPYFIDTGNIEGYHLLNEAIEHATDAGVLVVAAAGNAGDAPHTIGYPANAESALTVGALDQDGQVAFFSSRGPAPGPEYSLKPDVVAPGDNVLSTWPGGGYQALSGTSMAAPYVAGIAARLLGDHPEWGPLDVKSAIVHSAEDIGEDLWIQGSGRARYDAAMEQVVSVSASLNFGLVEPEQDEWSSSAPLRIRNLSDAPTSYSLTTGSVPNGVTVSVDQADVHLEPGEIATSLVQVTVGDDLPDRLDLPYLGDILLSDGQQTEPIPFTFLKSGYLDLRLYGAGRSRSYFVLDESGEELVTFGRSDSARILLDRGSYSVLAIMLDQSGDSRTFMYEPTVSIDPTAELILNDADAQTAVAFSTVDEHGMEYTTHELSQMTLLTHERVGLLSLAFSESAQFGGMPISRSFEIRSNGLGSDGFRLDWILRSAIHDDTQYIHKESVSDFDRRRDIPGNSRMVPYSIRHEMPRNVDEVWFLSQTLAGSLGSSSYTFGNPDTYLIAPYERRIVEMPDPNDEFPNVEHFSHSYELFDVARTDPSSESAPSLILSPFMNVGTGGRMVSRMPFWTYEQQPVTVSYLADEVIVPERGPYTWLGRLNVEGQTVRVATNTSRGLRWYARHYLQEPYLPLFISQSRAVVPGRAGWRLLDPQGHPILSGELGVDAEFDPETFERHSFDTINLPGAGPFDLEISSRSYKIAGAEARSRVRYGIGAAGTAGELPTMRTVQVYDASGEHTDHFDTGSAGRIEADFSDDSGVIVEGTAWRTHGADVWQPLSFSAEEGEVSVDIPATSTERYVDLQIRVTDDDGNHLEYEAIPAMVIGNPPIPINVEEPSMADDLPSRYALHQNWPNPFHETTRIEIELPRADHVRLVVYDLLGREVMAVAEGRREAGTHGFQIDGLGLAAGVYLCVLETPEFRSVKRMIAVH